MCECGCSQGPQFYFPGPRGITYGLELYAGCRDCGTAPAVSLFEIPKAALENFAPLDWREPMPWFQAPGWRQFDRAVMDAERFRERVALDEETELFSIADEDGEIPPDVAADLGRAALHALRAVAWREPQRTPTGETSPPTSVIPSKPEENL